MRTYTQLIEYLLRIATNTTAIITPSTWPQRNSIRIVHLLGYHQAGKSSHSSPTEDASNLYSLYAYHNIQNGVGKPWDPVLYCYTACIAARIFKENSAPFSPLSSLHQSPWWRSSYADARSTNVSDIYQCVGCNSFNLQVRCFQIAKFLYFFFIRIVLHFNINAIPNEKEITDYVGYIILLNV